jgi:hypothetical protein
LKSNGIHGCLGLGLRVITEVFRNG